MPSLHWLPERIPTIPERVEAFARLANSEVAKKPSKRKLQSLDERFAPLRSVYEVCDGFRFFWSTSRERRLRGTVNVMSLAEVSRLVKSKSHAFVKQIERGLIPFDMDGFQDGYGTFIDPDGSLVRVYPGLEFRLPVSVEHYLRVGFDVCGMFGWQDYLVSGTPVLERATYDGFFEHALELLGEESIEALVRPEQSMPLPSVSPIPALRIPEGATTGQRHRVAGPGSPIQVRLAQLGTGSPFPLELMWFYLGIGKTEVSWELFGKTTSFVIPAPTQAFNHQLDREFKPWDSHYGKHIRSKDPKFSEVYPLIRKEEDVVFRVDEGEVRLFLVDSNMELLPIFLSLDAFVRRLFWVGGHEGWERIFLHESIDRDHPDVSLRLRALTRSFPELDIDAFLAG